MSATTIQQASVFTGRQMVLVGVVGLHALVIGFLMTMKITIDRTPPPSAFKPIHTQLVDPVPPQPRPQLQPDETRPKISLPTVPGPIINRDLIPTVPTDIGLPTSPEAFVPGPVDAVGLAPIPATELRYRATLAPDDFYPTTSIQLQEEGTSVVRVCVAPSGRLEGSPTIERSSGYRRLDAAALQWAREALAFTPATRNGTAVAACKGFRVSFKLR